MRKTPKIFKPLQPLTGWFVFIRVLLILLLFISLHNNSFAYLRDANIADSKNSVGLGWYGGLSGCGEIKLTDGTSVGFFYLPAFSDVPSTGFDNVWDITFNWQVAGNKADPTAWSFFAGVFGDRTRASAGWDYEYMSNTCPFLGFAFSQKISESLKLKISSFFIIPLYIELGNKISENFEMSLAFGYPFQMVSFKYLF